MTTATFDTLAIATNLRTAGVENKQADAIVHAIVESQKGLATKADIALLRAELKADMNLLESRLKHDLTVRMGVMLVGTIGLAVAILTVIFNALIPVQ